MAWASPDSSGVVAEAVQSCAKVDPPAAGEPVLKRVSEPLKPAADLQPTGGGHATALASPLAYDSVIYVFS